MILPSRNGLHSAKEKGPPKETHDERVSRNTDKSLIGCVLNLGLKQYASMTDVTSALRPFVSVFRTKMWFGLRFREVIRCCDRQRS